MNEKSKLTLPPNTNFVGNFRGFSLLYTYASSGTYSERAFVYVFACSEEGEGADFAQVSAIRRTSDGEWNDSEVHRKLAKDALRRAKARIHNDSFEPGRVYALELDENGAACSFVLGQHRMNQALDTA